MKIANINMQEGAGESCCKSNRQFSYFRLPLRIQMYATFFSILFATLGLVSCSMDDINGLFCYIAEYQEIKIPLKNYFEWYKWSCRKIYWNITGYRNIPSISLANFWLGILGKSETGSLYLDL